MFSLVWHPIQTEHTSEFLSCSVFLGVFDCSGLVLVYSDGFSTAASGKRYWKRKKIHMYIKQKCSSAHVHMWNHFNVLINHNLKSGMKKISFLMYNNCLQCFKSKVSAGYTSPSKTSHLTLSSKSPKIYFTVKNYKHI